MLWRPSLDGFEGRGSVLVEAEGARSSGDTTRRGSHQEASRVLCSHALKANKGHATFFFQKNISVQLPIQCIRKKCAGTYGRREKSVEACSRAKYCARRNGQAKPAATLASAEVLQFHGSGLRKPRVQGKGFRVQGATKGEGL